MSQNFSEDFTFDVTFTTDADLNAGERSFQSADQVEAYLNENPRHAVVLHGSDDGLFGRVSYDPELYVLRGAGEDLNNFFWGQMPAEDPNDAEGGDIDADEALRAATVEYYE